MVICHNWNHFLMDVLAIIQRSPCDRTLTKSCPCFYCFIIDSILHWLYHYLHSLQWWKTKYEWCCQCIISRWCYYRNLFKLRRNIILGYLYRISRRNYLHSRFWKNLDTFIWKIRNTWHLWCCSTSCDPRYSWNMLWCYCRIYGWRFRLWSRYKSYISS